MKTSTFALAVVSSLFLATAGCGACASVAAAASVAQPAPPPPPPTPPNIVGGSGEGVLQSLGGRYLLRADDGTVLFELRDPSPNGNPRAALALHQGERVAVTGVVVGEAQGTKILRVASLAVTRGGEFDKVISTIAALRCPDVVFGIRDSYRLDPLHTTADARFQVYAGAGGASYLVWVRRDAAGFAVDSVLRFRGKAAVPVCARP